MLSRGIEDLDDVRVGQAHGELGLLDERPHEVRTARELRENPLDDEDLLEAFDAEALGLEHLGYAAAAKTLNQSIAAERTVHGLLSSQPERAHWTAFTDTARAKSRHRSSTASGPTIGFSEALFTAHPAGATATAPMGEVPQATAKEARGGG